MGRGTRMKRRCRQWLLSICFVPAIAGCAFAPGGAIPYDTAGDDIDELVDIEPITLGLVRAQAAESARQGALNDRSLTSSRSLAPDYSYRIGPGDILSVIVYDHPELTNPAGSDQSPEQSGNVVEPDGTLYYPYIGRIRVAGLTALEVRDELARRLADGYIASPQISVRVAAFNSQKAYVTGSVDRPGAQMITNVPLTILDAVAAAGGLSDAADWHNVVLTHRGQDIRLSVFDMLQRGDFAQNRLLEDGDVLHVPEVGNQKVYVLGEVIQPRAISMGNTRYSLTDALSQSGGINEGSANATGIFVIRRAPEGSQKMATVYQLDARNSAALMLGTEFMLKPTDIVYVTTTALGRWNRTISLLLPSVGSIYDISRTTQNVRDL
ncbi:polysaccharide export protein Wza [Halotalea alkalilenta]|uniref:Polysaccharide export protein Wza n=2 Tax=Halotalea alkalilenta TaxID=376489 RepID=A0A172YEU1_9GAMM|nr:polysaccharide export protein Wza [Halotalea alkalilenta]